MRLWTSLEQNEYACGDGNGAGHTSFSRSCLRERLWLDSESRGCLPASSENPGSRTDRSDCSRSVVYPLCNGGSVTGVKARPAIGVRERRGRGGCIPGVASGGGIDDAPLGYEGDGCVTGARLLDAGGGSCRA